MQLSLFFFFNDTATTEIYTLSLHDALPISTDTTSESQLYRRVTQRLIPFLFCCYGAAYLDRVNIGFAKLQMLRSEEHTSELQSLTNLVCRLLLEKKKNEATLRILSLW